MSSLTDQTNGDSGAAAPAIPAPADPTGVPPSSPTQESKQPSGNSQGVLPTAIPMLTLGAAIPHGATQADPLTQIPEPLVPPLGTQDTTVLYNPAGQPVNGSVAATPISGPMTPIPGSPLHPLNASASPIQQQASILNQPAVWPSAANPAYFGYTPWHQPAYPQWPLAGVAQQPPSFHATTPAAVAPGTSPFFPPPIGQPPQLLQQGVPIPPGAPPGTLFYQPYPPNPMYAWPQQPGYPGSFYSVPYAHPLVGQPAAAPIVQAPPADIPSAQPSQLGTSQEAPPAPSPDLAAFVSSLPDHLAKMLKDHLDSALPSSQTDAGQPRTTAATKRDRAAIPVETKEDRSDDGQSEERQLMAPAYRTPARSAPKPFSGSLPSLYIEELPMIRVGTSTSTSDALKVLKPCPEGSFSDFLDWLGDFSSLVSGKSLSPEAVNLILVARLTGEAQTVWRGIPLELKQSDISAAILHLRKALFPSEDASLVAQMQQNRQQDDEDTLNYFNRFSAVLERSRVKGHLRTSFFLSHANSHVATLLGTLGCGDQTPWSGVLSYVLSVKAFVDTCAPKPPLVVVAAAPSNAKPSNTSGPPPADNNRSTRRNRHRFPEFRLPEDVYRHRKSLDLCIRCGAANHRIKDCDSKEAILGTGPSPVTARSDATGTGVNATLVGAVLFDEFGEIVSKLRVVTVRVFGVTARFLIDTGAQVSLINRDIWQLLLQAMPSLASGLKPPRADLLPSAVNGSTLELIGAIPLPITLGPKGDQLEFIGTMRVVSSIAFDGILSLSFLQKHGLFLNQDSMLVASRQDRLLTTEEFSGDRRQVQEARVCAAWIQSLDSSSDLLPPPQLPKLDERPTERSRALIGALTHVHEGAITPELIQRCVDEGLVDEARDPTIAATVQANASACSDKLIRAAQAQIEQLTKDIQSAFQLLHEAKEDGMRDAILRQEEELLDASPRLAPPAAPASSEAPTPPSSSVGSSAEQRTTRSPISDSEDFREVPDDQQRAPLALHLLKTIMRIRAEVLRQRRSRDLAALDIERFFTEKRREFSHSLSTFGEVDLTKEVKLAEGAGWKLEFILPDGTTEPISVTMSKRARVEGRLQISRPEDQPQVNATPMQPIELDPHYDDEKAWATLPRAQDPAFSELERRQMDALTYSFRDVFATEPKSPPPIPGYKVRIDTGNSAPVRSAPRRYSPAHAAAIREHLRAWLAFGLIQSSRSPWSSPCLIVPKGPTTRLVIDFRKLNQTIRPSEAPYLSTEDFLTDLDGKQVFSVLDCAAGFLQLELDEDSMAKTSFSTPMGAFEFRRLPFGLVSSPAEFVRYMTFSMEDLFVRGLKIFVDDCRLATKDTASHLELYREFLERCRAFGISMNYKKAQLMRKEVTAVGFKISAGSISPDPKNVASVAELAEPSSIRETRSFLGFVNFYRAMIPTFSAVSEPLYAVINSEKFVWTPEASAAFKSLVKTITASPILCPPDFKRPFCLTSDASLSGFGAILWQPRPDGSFSVVGYCSKRLSAAERNKAPTELEILGVIHGLEKFSHLLAGGPVTVFTDAKALLWFRSLKSPTGLMARWSIRLSQFQVLIKHLPGKKNEAADFLSRYPTTGEEYDVESLIPDYDVPLPNGSVLHASPSPLSPKVAAVFVAPIPAVSVGPEEPNEDPDSVAGNDGLFSIDWSQQQRRDPELRVLFDKIAEEKEEIEHQGRSYRVQDGILQVLHSEPPRVNRWITVVPHLLRDFILRMHHGNEWAGHPGLHRTEGLILQRFWWSKLRQDVTNLVTHCRRCLLHKAPRRALAGGFHSRLASYPYQAWSFDVLGTLPMTARGNCFCLIAVDLFSRTVFLAPMSTNDSEAVVQALQSLFLRFAYCEWMVTDEGPTSGRSHRVRQYLKALGTQLFTAAPQHQQANGVERQVQVVKRQIGALIAVSRGDWDRITEFIQFELRQIPISGIGLCPDEIVRGTPSRWPAASAAPAQFEPLWDSPQDYSRFLQTVLLRYHQFVRSAQLDRSSKNRAAHQDLHKLFEIKTGSQVVVYNPRPKGKGQTFLSDWMGPYQVEQQLSDVGIYRLKHLKSDRIIERHQDLLLPYNVFEELPRNTPLGVPDFSLYPSAEDDEKSPIPLVVSAEDDEKSSTPLSEQSASASPRARYAIEEIDAAPSDVVLSSLTAPIPPGTLCMVRDVEIKGNFHMAVTTGEMDADGDVPLWYYGSRQKGAIHERTWAPAWSIPSLPNRRGRTYIKTEYATDKPTNGAEWFTHAPRAEIFAYGFKLSNGRLSKQSADQINAAFKEYSASDAEKKGA